MNSIKALSENKTLTLIMSSINFLKIIHYPEFNQIRAIWDFGDIDEIFEYKCKIDEVNNLVSDYISEKEKNGYSLNY